MGRPHSREGLTLQNLTDFTKKLFLGSLTFFFCPSAVRIDSHCMTNTPICWAPPHSSYWFKVTADLKCRQRAVSADPPPKFWENVGNVGPTCRQILLSGPCQGT